MKKGFSLDYLAVIVFVVTLLVSAAVITIATKGTLDQDKNLAVKYVAIKADGVMQGIVQGFEKTAIFFGVMNAENELGAHGGVSRSALSLPEDVYTPWMQSDSGTLYWAVARCNNTASYPGSEIRIRPPFVSYADHNKKLGTAAQTFTLVASDEYPQNIRDVADGKYAFHADARAFMLKQGSVTAQVCQEDRCTTPPQTISVSGTMKFTIDNSIVQAGFPPTPNIVLRVTGSAEDVAVLRTVSASIYDRDTASDLNTLLTRNIEEYRTKLIDDQKPTGVGFSNAVASLGPAGNGFYNTLDDAEGFSKGIVWAPDKLSVKYTDESSNSFVNTAGWGAAEEDVKIRYWRIQDQAYWFSKNYADWVKPRFFNQLQAKFTDHTTPRQDNACGTMGQKTSYDRGCPEDTTPQYTGEDFRRELSNKLAAMAADINGQFNAAGVGLRWEISVPSVFVGCSINQKPAANQIEWCNSQNMEYYKYKSGIGSGSWCTINRCGNTDPSDCDISCNDVNSCWMHYDQRYVLKNVPINVTIFDDKYMVFDAATRTWSPYRFTFFVEIDRVEDNTCGGNHYCSDRNPNAPASLAEPSITVPPELLNPPTTGCASNPAQMCIAGATCPSNIYGTGACNAGEVCCVDAPPVVSDCVLTTPLLGNCPPGTESCNTGCIPLLGRICCKPKSTCETLGGTCITAPPVFVNPCPADTPTLVPKNTISNCQGSDEFCCRA